MHLLLCGHGYLGQAISRDFLQAGWRVTALSQSPRPSTTSGLSERVADLSSASNIAEIALSLTQPDFIVHCASSGRGGSDAYRSVYLDGTRHLLENFPETPLLFTSSSSVYAQTDGSLVTETSPADPDRETGRILRAAEDQVLSHRGYVFRLSGIYGPHRSFILKKFLSAEATLEEDGRRILNQIHRDDAASAVLLAATSGLAPGIWNVSDSHPRSQRETFEGLAHLFDRPLPESAPRDPNRKRGWTHKQVSNAKLKAAGWKLRYPDFLDSASLIAESL
ncbi:nucleoside-diphosphate-sugar epimerase [Haloferula luteola]|uniref:Nucleoside-diphosphate-sugar epimerase n=1 Tax=Haloferula luteola TaxID=595692 RepID=A0A840VGD2_9BACT|nr:NAD-dependent epimerase/dehydratase family protein [Haloferula luteola]MBB5351851.1 nucleoside-diphosphate-sugar epimerase [Haloferula luteola]